MYLRKVFYLKRNISNKISFILRAEKTITDEMVWFLSHSFYRIFLNQNEKIIIYDCCNCTLLDMSEIDVIQSKNIVATNFQEEEKRLIYLNERKNGVEYHLADRNSKQK